MLTRLLEALEIRGFAKRGGKKKIADITRYSQGSVSDFLSGKEPLPDKFLKILCDELGISEAWIKTGEGEMFSPTGGLCTAGGPGRVIDGKMFGGSLEDQLAYEEWKKLSKDQKLFVIQILSASQSLSPDQLSQLEHLSRKLKEGS